MMRTPNIPETPITDETFERQGWRKHPAVDYHDSRDFFDNIDEEPEEGEAYFWSLPLPKDRIDTYAPILISSESDDSEMLISMGLKPGQYFVEIFDFDGLGFCVSEEELEILYYSLTKKYIEK
jgi:hypothetical protein